MITRFKPRKRRALYAFRAAIVLFVGYFIYHAFHGDHGLVAHALILERVAVLEDAVEALQLEKSWLQARVDGMRTSSLDADLLDLKARESLGLIAANERILLH